MVALKKQRKLTNREKIEGVKPIIAEKNTDAIWIGEYRDFRNSDIKPITELFIERLCREVIEWAEKQNKEGKEREIRLDLFFYGYGIPHSTWNDWKTRYPFFGESFKEAQRIIGRRREKDLYYNDGAAREGTRKDLAQFMGEFNDHYKDTLQMKADIDLKLHELKCQIDAQHNKSGGSNITVHMVPAVDTGKVKPKPNTKKEVSDE